MGEGVHTIQKKTDRSYLHDTDGGMNRQESFRVNQIESKIRNRKTEKGYVVGPDGNVIAESYKSYKDHCSWRVSDLAKSKDAIMTHNHPNDDLQGTIAGRIGLPFSDADLEAAVKFNLKEVRAVTPNYTYSIRRPKDGWGDSRTISRELMNWHSKSDYNYYQYRDARYRRNADRGETYDRANVVGQWTAWKETVKQLGWTITRKKVN